MAIPLDSASAAPAVTLRAMRGLSLIVVPFLTVWLAGWAVGEYFVGRVLFGIVLQLLAPGVLSDLEAHGTPPAGWGAGLVFLFLAVWFAFWTLGGCAALMSLLRTLFGLDVITVEGDTLVAWRTAGFLRSTKRIARSDLQAVTLSRRGGALVAQTAQGRTITLSDLGTVDQRAAALEKLRESLGLTDSPTGEVAAVPPSGWELVHDDTGVPVLRPAGAIRRAQVRVCATLTAGTAAITAALAWRNLGLREPSVSPGVVVALVFTLLLAWGTAALVRRRSEWRLLPGAVEWRRIAGGAVRTELFPSPELRVTWREDSDGDEACSLVVAAEGRSRKLVSTLNDPGPVRQLGAILALHTGRPLVDEVAQRDARPKPPSVSPRQALQQIWAALRSRARKPS